MIKSFPWLVANNMIECAAPSDRYDIIATDRMPYKRFYNQSSKNIEFEIKFLKKSLYRTANGLNEIIHSCSPQTGEYLFYSVIGNVLSFDSIVEIRSADEKSFEWNKYPVYGVAEMKKVVTNDDQYYVKIYVKFNMIGSMKTPQIQSEMSVMDRKLKEILD